MRAWLEHLTRVMRDESLPPAERLRASELLAIACGDFEAAGPLQ